VRTNPVGHQKVGGGVGAQTTFGGVKRLNHKGPTSNCRKIGITEPQPEHVKGVVL